MQASIPTSKFSRLKSATTPNSTSQHSPSNHLRSTGVQIEEQRHLAATHQSAQPPPPAELAARSADRDIGRPSLDARVESSGSIRRANPARYRARHPDDLDPHRDPEAESSSEEEPRHARVDRGNGLISTGDDQEEQTGNKAAGRPSGEPLDTPPGVTTWIADADELASDDSSSPPTQHSHEGPADPKTLDASDRAISQESGLMDEVAIKTRSFHGLTDHPLDLGKDRRLIDDDYLRTAFGITMARRPSEDEKRPSKTTNARIAPRAPSSQVLGSPRSEKSGFFEMEVPLAFDPRDLDLGNVPNHEQAPANAENTIHQDAKGESDSDGPGSAASSASTLKQAQALQASGSGTQPTTVAIVSPDQVLESPKPRRPFSTVSISEMTASQGLKSIPSHQAPMADFNSSAEETSGPEEKFSDQSTGTSMSSAEPGNSPVKPREGHDGPIVVPRSPEQGRPSIPDGLETVHEAHTIIHPTQSTNDSRSVFPPLKNSYAQNAPTSTFTGAATSRQPKRRENPDPPKPALGLRRYDTDSVVVKRNAPPPNKNKPLPPEPPKRNTAGLSYIGEASSSSLGSSTTLSENRSHRYNRGDGRAHYGSPPMSHSSPKVPQGSPQALNVARMDSRVSTLSGWSLRSKYTPKDLDALDDAFVQRDRPERTHEPGSPYQDLPASNQLGTHDQLQLRTIPEKASQAPGSDHANSYHKSSISDPYQRSRGPMLMEPSRRPPQIPPNAVSRQNSLISIYHEQSRGQPSLAAAHGRRDGDVMMQRSATIGAPQSRSEQDLPSQRAHVPSIVPPLPMGHSETKWPRQEYEPYSAIERRAPMPFHMNEEDSAQINAADDEQVAEIRERLELLNPRKADTEDRALNEDGASSTRERQLFPGPSRRWKRTTPLAELSAQFSPRIFRAQGIEFEPVEPESTDSRKAGYTPQLLPSLEPTSRATPFVPPPPPPPPSGDTPPPGLERRSKAERSDASSSPQSYRRSDQSSRVTRVRSIASLVASEIPDIYALVPSNPTSLRPSMTAEEAEQISAEAAERVLLRILQNLQTFADLFSAAQVSRGFYRTFKRHELSLLKNALFRMSPPAWELREVSIPRLELLEDGTEFMRNLYFSHYMRDLSTLTDLKALILKNCDSMKIRPDTVRDLRTEGGQTAVDAAFWRIWTFCKLFGCGNNRELDILGQMDWLRGGKLAREPLEKRHRVLASESSKTGILYDPPTGFATGNGPGLTPDELYDMTELWECLEALLRGYVGQRQLAGEFGIFDRMRVIKGDEARENALIDEWTYYLLSRAPHVILRAAAPTPPTREEMARLRQEGLTSWKPLSSGQSRNMFLKEALSHVYDEQIREHHPLMAPKVASPMGFSDLPQVVSPTSGPAFAPHAMNVQPGFHPPVDPMLMNGAPAYGEMPRANPLSPASPPVSAPMSNFYEVLARIEQANAKGENSEASGPKRMKLFGRKRARTGPDRDKKEKDQLANIEAILYPNGASNSAQGSPTASTFSQGKTKKGGKNFITSNTSGFPRIGPRPPFAMGDRQQASQTSLVSVPSQPDADGTSIRTQSDTLASPGSGDQALDPLKPMVEHLVSIGFEEVKARKALVKNTQHNFIDFKAALASLIKQREAKRKMERLDRMG